MTWLVWFFLCFGLVYLVVGASITAWPRRFLFNVLGPRWGGWLACAPCAAFWVGALVGTPYCEELSNIGDWAVPAWVWLAWRHFAGGVILMGTVAFAQFVTNVLFAEIGREAARKERDA